MHSELLVDEDCDPLGSFVQLNTACLAKNMTLGMSVCVCELVEEVGVRVSIATNQINC